MSKLILASKSPRRQKILKESGFDFVMEPADIKEEEYENLSPLEMVKILSKLKAEKIFVKFKNNIVIGADTTVDLDGKILSKAKDLDHAKKMLQDLSGTRHKVITGYTIISAKESITSYDISFVKFKVLTNNEIDDYINSTNVLGFAGAYGIQDGADKFVEKIDGDMLNVLGLPTKAINDLKKILK